MASATARENPFSKLLAILKLQSEDITSIYFLAILSGLVSLSLPLGIQSIISYVLGGAISTSLVLLIIAVIVGVFLAGLLQVNQMKLIEKIQQQIFVRYSFLYASTIPNLDLKSVDNYYLPELVNRFIDTITLQKSISKLLIDVPVASIQIVFGLVLLSFYHPVFIFFGMLLLITLYLILMTTANRGMQTSLLESDYKYKVLGHLEELARVVTTIKFSRSHSLHLEKTDTYVTGYVKARTAHFKILVLQYWTLIGFKVTITAAMLIVGAWLLVDQQLNIGQFISAEIVILLVINSIEKLILNLDNVYDVLTAVEKITKVTEKPLEPNGSLITVASQSGFSLAAQNVSFSYSEGQPILRHINLNIAAGEKVAIQGADGSGKSTLLRLLSGAYPSFEGQLLFNGVPLQEYDTASLRANTGIMLNALELFEGTLFENITLGDENISYQQVDELGAITGLKTFVYAHQDGYTQHIRPMGQHLATSIIRRILLMRALIHRPALLLLEEPFRFLEPPYDQRVRDYLLRDLQGTTMLVVTSDPSFIAQCNQIITLSGGSIAQQAQPAL